MSKVAIEQRYITPVEIAKHCGVPVRTVHNWLVNNRFMTRVMILGRPVVERADFEAFKAAHPELVGGTRRTKSK